jgi:hypothetical protein
MEKGEFEPKAGQLGKQSEWEQMEMQMQANLKPKTAFCTVQAIRRK